VRRCSPPALHLPEQPPDHSLVGLVLLKVDQELAEGPCLRVPPELTDTVGSLEVGEAEDVDKLAASRRRQASRRARSAASISSKVSGKASADTDDGLSKQPRSTSRDRVGHGGGGRQ